MNGRKSANALIVAVVHYSSCATHRLSKPPGTHIDFVHGIVECLLPRTCSREWSPELARLSNESGQLEVYVRPFPNVDDGKWQISTAGGVAPVWGPNGQELFYSRNPGDTTTMMAVAVATEPSFTQGTPAFLFEGPYLSFIPGRRLPFDISPDGERFLMIKTGGGTSDGTRPQINVVLNWYEELLERVPTP